MLTRLEFAKQISQAFENLYDNAYLQNLPLTRALSRSGQTLEQSVRLLRAELLRAVEELDPGHSLSPRARERRPYALLYGRYVQGLTTVELLEELAISLRQLRREHKRALEAATGLLWERLADSLSAPAQAGQPPVAPSPDGRQQTAELEAEQLIGQARAEDLSMPEVIRGILPILHSVAAGRGVQLESRLDRAVPSVRADRVILRQAILELGSYAMDWTAAGKVTIACEAGARLRLRVTATGEPGAGAASSEAHLDISRRLITGGIGGSLTVTHEPGCWQALAELPVVEDAPIVVMDDNQGLVELFRRYLAGGHYRVIHALTAEEALAQAREAPLRLIILDVMMPGQDGWEVLQYLRAAPETRDVPILVCSVLNEPEIAQALGASDCVTKPVTQDVLLQKVERWCGSPF